MEIEIGNLISKLKTDNPELLKVLNEKYAFRVPGYQYTPQYKRKVWDGKKSYFKKTGEFRTGLLERVLEDLHKIGVNKNICSGDPILTDPIHYSVVDVKNFTYFDYQKEAIEAAITERRAIIESPVGSGKTLIMAGIAATLYQYRNCKMVVMFKEKGILKQTYDFFKKCGIKNLGINSGEGYIDGDIMLTTVQSIDRILDTHLDQAEVLMIDEAHQFCKGETTVAAIESFKNAIWRVAFTATVPSEKNDIHGRLTLEGAFGPVYSTVSMDDLIKDGKIAKPIIQIVEFAPRLEKDDKELPYQEIYDKYVISSKERNAKIAEIASIIRANNKESKTLILCKNLSQVQALKDLIPDSMSVEGKDSLDERYSIISKFVALKGHPVLIGTNVLQTGININEITHMINARGLVGEIPTIQGLGRGVRKAEGKTEMHFYDFYDKIPDLEKHSKSRIKHYEALKFEITYVKL